MEQACKNNDVKVLSSNFDEERTDELAQICIQHNSPNALAFIIRKTKRDDLMDELLSNEMVPPPSLNGYWRYAPQSLTSWKYNEKMIRLGWMYPKVKKGMTEKVKQAMQPHVDALE